MKQLGISYPNTIIWIDTMTEVSFIILISFIDLAIFENFF